MNVTPPPVRAVLEAGDLDALARLCRNALDDPATDDALAAVARSTLSNDACGTALQERSLYLLAWLERWEQVACVALGAHHSSVRSCAVHLLAESLQPEFSDVPVALMVDDDPEVRRAAETVVRLNGGCDVESTPAAVGD